jgi:hypothetical protein
VQHSSDVIAELRVRDDDRGRGSSRSSGRTTSSRVENGESDEMGRGLGSMLICGGGSSGDDSSESRLVESCIC